MSLRFFRFALVLSLGAFAFSLHAQQPEPAAGPAAAEEMVGPIKLPDADIDTVLGLLEIYTGRSILRPQQLPTATYRVVIDRKVTKSEAIMALETALSLNQIGVAPLGDKFLKVVALSQVKTEAPEMIEGSTLGLAPSGRVATKLFQLDFLRVNEFVPQITPLLTPGVANGVVPLDKANAALITDTVSNLQRIEMLLQQLDKPSMAGLTPKFYQLNFTKASDLVTKLRGMFQGPLQNQLGSSISYNADDRTNQVILLSDPRQHPLFDELIAKLDVRAEPNTRNEVIYLKHASAKDVAPLLSQLVSGQNTAAQKAAGTSGSVRAPVPQPNQPNQAATPDAAVALAGATVDTNEFSSYITILPDERSNSIVVSGTVDDIRLIRDLVEKVDILLAQVRIEVIIAEVTLDDSNKTGLSALNLTVATPQGSSQGTHITNFAGKVAGWDISQGVVNPLAFQAALGDAGTRSNVKILSAPTIVTTHNKEAQILVGESLPIITGIYTTAVGSTTPTEPGFAQNQQVTYKDIAIDLKVTPLIGDDGSIQLKIDQKVDDVVRTISINNSDQPVIGRRQATSFINVSDGQIVVLGGLQRTANTRGRNKLGFLVEIPILSHLFGARTNSVRRTELLLFIRPHVIAPDAGTADATNTINSLSNKEQINQYLSDPSKQPKEKLIEKLK
ncbi:secretin N-terminal domain-containing protein [Opitutus terrae]|uniref:Type II and III secretion system protein n=1 Tax=Opitutus terrae (strain DSM 11246 / JCM 15787 / PB90-1) TaxID=452637 RepID=B1ZUM2_OPITP|nr:secretin N-terminal domain-containing protein [Opitutus terrae]ACB74906.1 type II and III secretion system protein [Opitutus terrae PB90-1]